MDRIENHVSEDNLEAFAIKKLTFEESERVEDHLLVCEECRMRLVETEEFVHAAKEGAARIRGRFPASQAAGKSRWRAILFARPALSVLAVAAVGVIAVLLPLRRAPPGYQEVALATQRGVESPPVLSTERRGQLQLDISGVPRNLIYLVSIVSANGGEIWHGELRANEAAAKLPVTLDRTLSSGNYWVRLSAPGSAAPLREYALRVQ